MAARTGGLPVRDDVLDAEIRVNALGVPHVVEVGVRDHEQVDGAVQGRAGTKEGLEVTAE
jgi:hypothetical protein